MTLTLRRIVIFVENLDRQTTIYGDLLALPAHDIRAGWSEFDTGDCTIALHRGKGRKPRLEFVTDDDLADILRHLKARGLKAAKLETRLGTTVVAAKDAEGNSIQIANTAA